MDPKTGLLKWTPARSFTPGKYDVTVTVKDSASEPKSASAVISLDVQDDHAAMTLLSGTVSRDDVWYAWLRNKGTGVTIRPRVGETIRISEVTAEIVSITNRFITMKDDAGVWKLELGEGLRDRKLIEPAAKPPETPDAVTGNAAYDANPAASTTAAGTTEVKSIDTPAPDSPAPDTPAPDTPAPDSPAPDSPAPDSPAPDSPAPDSPAPDSPAPDSPAQTPEPPAVTQPADDSAKPANAPAAPTEKPPAVGEQPGPPQQP
jgi:hypothetical protein